MNKSEIFARIEFICHELFGKSTVITERTSAAEVEKWDSMNHVVLIAAIEKEFGLHFDIMEIIGVSTIGGFVELVDRRLA